MPKLLSQSPKLTNGKVKKDLLKNRLKKWKEVDLKGLLDEGRMIQSLLVKKRGGSGLLQIHLQTYCLRVRWRLR